VYIWAWPAAAAAAIEGDVRGRMERRGGHGGGGGGAGGGGGGGGGAGRGGAGRGKTDYSRLRAKLKSLVGSGRSHSFPPSLSSDERRYVHEEAGRLGLAHDSVGMGGARRVVVEDPKRGIIDSRQWASKKGPY
jgi:hypothetical protein